LAESDAALIRASREGEREAFRELVERYFRRIVSVATGMLRNTDDARDIAQETFIKAYENLAGFKGGASFYTWLYRIAINLCIDHQRREARSPIRNESFPGANEPAIDIGDRVADPTSDPFDETRRRELADQVMIALDELTPEHRAVILLREVEGLSYDEISDVLQCAKGTVMSRLHYARKRLQGRLREHR
jgi:RNA polymerase sigma-70 factor (ECF subfamily)